MSEQDVCKSTPLNIDAFNKGLEIGEKSSHDGNIAAALAALSTYTQSLFRSDKSLPADQRQKAWQDQSRDAMNGLACGDQIHFKQAFRAQDSDPRKRPEGPERAKLSDVSNLVDGAYSALESPANRNAGTLPPFDYRLAQANAFVHNRVEPLGEDSRKAFVEDFNNRIAPKMNSQDGINVVAELAEDGSRVQIRRVLPAPAGQ